MIIRESRATSRMDIGFYIRSILRSHSRPYVGSMSVGLTRNIDGSSCEDSVRTVRN